MNLIRYWGKYVRKGEVKGRGAYTQVRDSATFVDLKREANQIYKSKG